MNENMKIHYQGKIYVSIKQVIQKDIKNYDKVININETNSNALYNKAVTLIKKGNQKSITNLFKRAKKFDDDTYILYAYCLIA